MISWINDWWKRRKHDKIVSEYRTVASAIGLAISYMGFGDTMVLARGAKYSIRDPQLYHVLDELEESYAELGYRIIPMSAWIDYAGWGVELEEWLVKREDGERPIFTKLQPRTELPKRSPLFDLIMETGKPCEAYFDDDGEMQYRVIEDK